VHRRGDRGDSGELGEVERGAHPAAGLHLEDDQVGGGEVAEPAGVGRATDGAGNFAEDTLFIFLSNVNALKVLLLSPGVGAQAQSGRNIPIEVVAQQKSGIRKVGFIIAPPAATASHRRNAVARWLWEKIGKRQVLKASSTGSTGGRRQTGAVTPTTRLDRHDRVL